MLDNNDNDDDKGGSNNVVVCTSKGSIFIVIVIINEREKDYTLINIYKNKSSFFLFPPLKFSYYLFISIRAYYKNELIL